MTRQIELLSDEAKKEKSRLTIDCIKLGALLILYQIFNLIFINVFYYVSYFVLKKEFALSYDKVIKYLLTREEVISSTVYKMSANIFTTGMSIIVLFILAHFVFKIRISHFFKPRSNAVKQGFIWVSACFVMNMIFSLAGSIITGALNSGGITVPTSDFSIKNPSAAAVIIQLIYSIILAPLFEELIYRGLILSILSPYSKAAAVLISALSFGLMHGNIPQAISACAAGAVYAMIAVYCNSVVPTIIIHSMNNIFAGFTDIGEALNIPYYEEIFSLFIIVLALSGFFVIFTRARDIRIKDKDHALSEAQIRKYTLLNPAIALYFIILIFTIIKGIFLAN